MTTDAARLLDELMGRHRNAHPNDQPKESNWDDEDVCKHFLCGFCPYELFNNTRADLGICDKIHDEKLVEKYRKSSRYERQGYEDTMSRFLQKLLSDVERRIQRGHARLAQNAMMAAEVGEEKNEQLSMLNMRINDLLEQAEGLGCEGKVEEAQGIMKLCDQLKQEREELQNAGEGQKKFSYEEEMAKRMEVCEVCGALLVAGDTQQRIDEHIMGKQHMGYARIRAYVEDRKRKRLAPIEEREARQKAEREEREKQREVEREERRKRDEEREKEREKERIERQKQRMKEREERDKEREKEREERRARDKEREKERGDRRRSRSRDRNRRSRSRDGRGDRRHRSRSRDRRHRSRSGDRHRDRRNRSRDRDHHRSSREHDRGSREQSSTKDRDNKSHEAAEKIKEHGNENLNYEETGQSRQESVVTDDYSFDRQHAEQRYDDAGSHNGISR